MYFLKFLVLFFLSVLCLVLIMLVLKFIAFFSSFLFGFDGEILLVSVLFFSFILFVSCLLLFSMYEEYQDKKGGRK